MSKGSRKKQKPEKRKISKQTANKVNTAKGKAPNSIDLKKFLFPGIIVLVFLLTYTTIFDTKLDLGGDNAGYYILGKALATGRGYSQINAINAHPANHFPPGYPAVISIVMSIFNDNIITVKIANGVMFLASLLILFHLFEIFSKNKLFAFSATILLTLNMHLLRYSTIMMSEISYLFFSLLAILIFIKMDKHKNPVKNPLFFGMLAALMASIYIRTAGVALLGGIVLYLLVRKNWKYAISSFAGFIILILPWQIRSQSLGGSPYIKQLLRINPYRPELGPAGIGDFINRFFANLQRYITKEIPTGLFPFKEVQYDKTQATEWILGIILIGLIIYGIYNVKAYRDIFITLIICTFGILLLWPEVWYGVRFVLPLIPFLMFCALWGLYELLNILLTKANSSLNPLILLILALLNFSPIQELKARAKAPYPPAWKNYFDLAEYAQKNVSPNDVICCRKPFMFYVFSKRYTCYYKNTPDKEEFLKVLDERSVDYVVLEQLGFGSTARYLYPVIKEYQEKFPVVYQLPNPATYLLKYNPKKSK